MLPMVTRIRAFAGFALVVALLHGWPGAVSATPRVVSDRTVIVISLDGVRPADLDDPDLPTFRRLMKRGAVARRMLPVFPTNTFPNHVTLVTGVAPETHGIVNNTFFDRERGLFRKENDPTWIEVEPIWAIAARHGVVSASYHWVGSQGPWRNGAGARHWEPFSIRTSETEKVERFIAWLDIEDDAERPRLITSWFRGADGAGHKYGPGSSQTRELLRSQDRALAALVAGIEARGGFDAVTLLLVSDHGMVPVERHVDLAREFRQAGLDARVLGGGGVALVSLAGGASSYEEAATLVASLGLRARRPGAVAAGGGHGLANPRFGDLVATAPVGTAISSGSTLRGSHGYPPEEPAMGGILIAVGASIPAGTRLGEVRALDVAPTVLSWLGIDPPEWMEGRPIAQLVAGKHTATAGPPRGPGTEEGR
jgi:hypothetical protein